MTGSNENMTSVMANSADATGTHEKATGSFYTPPDIVACLLDLSGWTTDNLVIQLSAGRIPRLIDPACGDGAILVEAERRLIVAGGSTSDITKTIRGIELDATETNRCRRKLAETAVELGIEPPDVDTMIIMGDAFDVCKSPTNGLEMGTFDHVVGNPPYVRIHNMGQHDIGRYMSGMCDLYYAFYDLGQWLMTDTGSLTYISPSSWFTSNAGRLMRDDIMRRGAIEAICDLKHYQVFAPHAQAYTAIVKLTRGGNDEIRIMRPTFCGSVTDPDGSDANGRRVIITGFVEAKTVRTESCWHFGAFMPDAPSFIDDVMSAAGDVRVRTGYQTADRMFVSKTRRDFGTLERPIVKASTGKTHWMLYPYDESGRLLSLEEIRMASQKAYDMFSDAKNRLMRRSQISADAWWGFGRSQGIADTFTGKVCVQALIRQDVAVRCTDAPSGTGVYGGFYVMGMPLDDVTKAMNSDELMAYATAIRKYKSGGYYALGGKDIERFLNWYVAMR